MKILQKEHLYYLLLILLFNNFSIFSQNYNSQIINPVPEKIFSASPDVMAFQKYNISEVNLYTGKTDVKIPIYEIISGNINISISLNYDSSGIKVDDRASSVGFGWVLNAGGNIIRIVNDVPDNEVTVATQYLDGGDTGVHIMPYIKRQGYNRKKNGTIPLFSPYYRYSNFPNDSPVFLYREDINENETDGENGHFWADWTYLASNDPNVQKDIPDTFIVNAPGLSSKFITTNNTNQTDIYPNNNTGFVTTFLDNAGLKMNSLIVDKRENPGFGFYNYVNLGENNLSVLNANPYHQVTALKKIKDFYEFNIVNTNGIKYKFSEEEVNENFYRPFGTIPVPSGSCSGNMDLVFSYHANYYNKRIHTWNLSKIEDDKTNKTVNFLYDTYSNSNLENNILIDTKVNLTVSSQNENQLNKCILTPYLESDPYNYLKMTSMTKNPKRKRLTSIAFDEGTVIFQYGLIRQDYIGENALTEIIVKDKKDNTIKRFVLNYSYFDSKENCTDPDCKRLKLENVKVYGSNYNTVFNTYTLEYEYTNKLPRRGSLERDYLGYYNNNGAANTTSNVLLTPTLFFYKNNNENSVLPFPLVNNNSFQTIPGNYSLIPNSYSLTGLLKKLTYPTGGSVEFEYENNQFQYLGQNYLSGGARIKSQKLTDNNNVAKKIDYTYVDQNGKSSGYINNIPKFANIIDFYIDTMVAKSFSVYDIPKGGIELTSGSFVGYSKITETEVNNGYTKYEFSSPNEYPNTPGVRGISGTPVTPDCTYCQCLFMKNSAYPMLTYIDNENRRGKLINKTIYNSSNQILDQEINEYTYRIINSFPISTGVDAFYRQYYSLCDTNVTNDYGFTVTSNIPVSQNLLTKKTNSKYLNNNIVTTTTDIQYDSSLPFVTNEIYHNGLSDVKIEKSYPYFSNQLSAQPILTNLVSKNRIDEVVTEKTYRDNVLINTKQSNYNDFGSGLILSKSISTSVGAQALEEQDVIDLRDNKGNILQYHNKVGTNVSIIWGYNQSQPIAKIENMAYSSIPANLVTDVITKSNTYTEANLKEALNSLRAALPNAMVTTYTYIPLVGISSITDPKGAGTYYSYDENNRLWLVRDKNFNVLQRYCYNYKGQQTDCTKAIYSSVAKSKSYVKNDCGWGSAGTSVVYNVPAGTYISTISQADADNKADVDANVNGQNYANANGICTQSTPIYDFDYDYDSENNQMTITVKCNMSTHAQATFNFTIFYLHLNETNRTLTQSVVLPANQLSFSKTFTVLAQEIQNVRLDSMVQ
ncbi:DUF5977 domain-containing protein [Flavobacterium soyae]|uniref:DUF5977 domain-containing protein n=1 Tax=Flavobacterium soyae TaxID=2903098 RepID=A0ABZ2UKX9_9FLAO